MMHFSRQAVLYLFLLLFGFPLFADAQDAYSILKGIVADARTQQPLSGVVISNGGLETKSHADGSYLLKLVEGSYDLKVKAEGFRSQDISIDLKPGVNVYNFRLEDSVEGLNGFTDDAGYEPLSSTHDAVPEQYIGFGTDVSTASLLKKLNGVIVEPDADNSSLQNLRVLGFGNRHNQLMLNGALWQSSHRLSNAYPLSLLPAEAIENVNVFTVPGAELPTNYIGGTVNVNTIAIPNENFGYIHGTLGFKQDMKGDFLSDVDRSREFWGSAGNKKDLPAGFPDQTVKKPFNTLSTEEQINAARTLPNNLAPTNQGAAKPDDRFVLGFGRRINLNNGGVLGLVAFLSHEKQEEISGNRMQAMPDVTHNPYPFDRDLPLIRSYSLDSSYSYTSGLGAVINIGLLTGQSKITFKNFFGSQLENIFTARRNVIKPDEDDSAHLGLRYFTEQRKFVNSQLAGEHQLGEQGRFRMDWNLSYMYLNKYNPDERNFLLRGGENNTYEIATPISNSFYPIEDNTDNYRNISYQFYAFISSGRSWTRLVAHDYSAAVNLQTPFSAFNGQHVLRGGISYISQNHTSESEFFNVVGKGFALLGDLLSPEKYGTGDSLQLRPGLISLIPANMHFPANYQASLNKGAAYLQAQSRYSEVFSSTIGLRLESAAYQVYDFIYSYAVDSTKARKIPIFRKTNTAYPDMAKFYVLPYLQLQYQPIKSLQLNAAYNKSRIWPALQDLNHFNTHNPLNATVTTGNTLLLSSNADHFNVGISFSPAKESEINVSAYYKKIDHPIEYTWSPVLPVRYDRGYTGTNFVVPHNMPKGEVKGISLDLKTNLAAALSSGAFQQVLLFGNATYNHSKVAKGPVTSKSTPRIEEHPLSNTPEYALNGGISIQGHKFPELTVLGHYYTDQLLIVGSGIEGGLIQLPNGNTVVDYPSLWQKGRKQLDVRLAQRIFKAKLQLAAGINNLLSSHYLTYQDLNGNEKYDNWLILRPNDAGNAMLYQDGTDNTVSAIKPRRQYYFTLSWLFN